MLNAQGVVESESWALAARVAQSRSEYSQCLHLSGGTPEIVLAFGGSGALEGTTVDRGRCQMELAWEQALDFRASHLQN